MELIRIRHSFMRRVSLDNTVCVQSHVFPTGIVMDIICTLADPSGINGRTKARLGLDRAIDHRLRLLIYDRNWGERTYGNG